MSPHYERSIRYVEPHARGYIFAALSLCDDKILQVLRLAESIISDQRQIPIWCRPACSEIVSLALPFVAPSEAPHPSFCVACAAPTCNTLAKMSRSVLSAPLSPAPT